MRFKGVFIFLLIVFNLILFACQKEGQNTTYDGREFDISVNQDGSLIGKTTKNGTNYVLTISGTGASLDYEKKEKVPWNAIGKKITSLKVEEGITKVGSFLFYSLNVEEVFLPSTVTSISENVTKDNINVYCYSSSVETNNKNVYLYSETNKGGKYFHIVDDKPYIWKNYSFLFIGNSFTYCPSLGSEDNAYIPNLFKQIASDLGVSVEVDFVTKGSHTLTKFGDKNDSMGAIVETKLQNNQYDFIILQEHSTTPINYYSTFNDAVSGLKEKINKYQDHADIRLYETWGFPGDTGRDVVSMCNQLTTAYSNCGKENGLVVNKVGQAFKEVYVNNKDINLYLESDMKHPGAAGSYLSALVHIGSMLGLDVRNTNVLGGLSKDVATTLQSVAYKIVFE